MKLALFLVFLLYLSSCLFSVEAATGQFTITGQATIEPINKTNSTQQPQQPTQTSFFSLIKNFFQKIFSFLK